MTISENLPASTLFEASQQPTNQQHTAADLIVKYLQQLEVEYVFGIPGGAIEPFYNALASAEQGGGPKAITARHETGAAFMADGYHWQTGKLGVCCATTGPGATNLITGVASAYANRVPLLVITAQTPLSTFGRQAFQESSCTGINTLAMLEPCTHFNTLVSHPDQLEMKLVNAVMTAMGQNPGPVHLSIPMDILASNQCAPAPQFNLDKLIALPPTINQDEIESLATRMMNARKIVFVIGESAVQAIDSILTLADLLDAELITTPQGKGIVSPFHPAYRGVYGFAGHSTAYQTLSEESVDTVICVGAILSEWASNGWDTEVLMNKRLVHVDQWEQNFLLTPMACLQIHGDISSVFANALQHLSQQPSMLAKLEAPAHNSQPVPTNVYFEMDEESSYYNNSTPIHPAKLMKGLTEVLPRNTRYLADVGASFAWAIHYLHPFDRRLKGLRNARGGLFRTCIEFSAMGWAIGSAVGTALALKNQPVACITGDGSLLMNGQEITIAAQEELPVIFVVLNDSALGMVKHGQQLTGASPIGFEMPMVDFCQFAESMGVAAMRIESPEDLAQLSYIDFKDLPKPLLLDVRIDQNAVPPIGKRAEALKK